MSAYANPGGGGGGGGLNSGQVNALIQQALAGQPSTGIPSGSLSIPFSGAFTPAGGNASATPDRAITNAEWDADGGIVFTGAHSSGNSRTAPYVVTLPQGDDNEGTARLVYNASTSFVRVMTAARIAMASPNGRRGYAGSASVLLEPTAGGFLSIPQPAMVDFIADAHTSRDLLVYGREILVLRSTDRTAGAVTLTRAQAIRYGTIFLNWGGWASGNEIRFPFAGTWTLVNWANNSNITWRGVQNARRTVITRGGGAKSIVNVTVDGDVDLLNPDVRIGSATIPAASGGQTTQTVSFTRLTGAEALPFGGTARPNVSVSASRAGGGIVSARTASGFTVNRLSQSYTLQYIAMRA